MHVTPANRRTYEAPHIKNGSYVENSWEHHRYHKILIMDTRSVYIGKTVFFRHKYITQPTVTMADAILRAGDDKYQALKGVIPENGATRTAVDYLMGIFKKQAKTEETATDTQRVLRQKAQAQRFNQKKQRRKPRASGCQQQMSESLVTTISEQPDHLKLNTHLTTKQKPTNLHLSAKTTAHHLETQEQPGTTNYEQPWTSHNANSQPGRP